MAKFKVIILSLLVLISTAIAALAADAAAPTAPAVQSAAWTAEDYLRAALSGAAGGLISGFVALIIGWMNNKNALKLNQQKIDADKKNLETQLASHERNLNTQHKVELEKINFEEKKKALIEYFELMHPNNFLIKPLQFEKCERAHLLIYLLCPWEYYSHINKLRTFLITNPNMMNFHTLFEEETHQDSLKKSMDTYIQYYNDAWAATKKLFTGEVIEPVSPPIDSQRLIP